MSNGSSRESAPDSIPLTEGNIGAESVDRADRVGAEHYTALFSRALEELNARHLSLGADELAAAKTHGSVLQGAYHYLAPLRKGDAYYVEARMLEFDLAHMRVFFTMWHEDSIAATCEQALRNSDSSEQPVTFPAAAKRAIERMHKRQAGLPLPRQAGAGVALP
jgi:acyl-CoA thioesterase FadM